MTDFHAEYLLQGLNTLALPSIAQYYCEIASLEELQEARRFALEHRLPITLLGGGSNVVLGARIPGLVVRPMNTAIEAQSVAEQRMRVTVGAGKDWHQLVVQTLAHGWFGLENLALIPGNVGAAPIQNIGAYGVEIERFLRGVHAVELGSGESVWLSAADCELGYRDSIFKGRYRDRFAILAIELELSLTPTLTLEYPALRQALEASIVHDPAPLDVFEAVCDIRRAKLPDPTKTPNVGSFFKNPIVAAGDAQRLTQRYPELVRFPQPDGRVKLAAAWLIDRAGWKGLQVGNVGVHSQQALVLCHRGKGTAQELLELARQIAASVNAQFGVELEMEPRCYGCEL